MNKCALYIPRPGATYQVVQQGYVDTLRHLGWKVYVGDPKTKLCCREWIEKYGIKLIMTHSRHGVRQLPIGIINDNNVAVAVDILPLNASNSTIDGPYEYAHDDEPDRFREIETISAHTRLEPSVWSEYMCGWDNGGIAISHIPVAGNLIKALPPTCSILTDVAMVANFAHRQGIMKGLIEPLFKHLDLLGYSYQAFGDNIWQLAGLNYNGPLSNDNVKLSRVYGTAKVCPNVHTEKQVATQAYINDRSFMIPLCGGVQVSDNPLAIKYLGGNCEVATSTTDFMNRVVGLVKDHPNRSSHIMSNANYVANRHTYFNRLSSIFHILGLHELSKEVDTKGQVAAVRHCFELGAILDAAERGVSYGQKEIIGIA